MITSFSGGNAFLSNFYEHEFLFEGRTWKTAEHAYQAMKSDTEYFQEKVMNAATPAEAKKIGRTLVLRGDWNHIKLGVMQSILEVKFERGTELADKLLLTFPERLIEGNTWGDKYWGQVKHPMDGLWTGENWLGKLLMIRRAQLSFAM